MYRGESAEASPIATPPMIRHATNVENVLAAPVPIDEIAKSSAEAMSRRLRP